MIKKYVCIPRGFLVINVCIQGKNLCSPCIMAMPFSEYSTIIHSSALSIVEICASGWKT
jgi:hypothetical protein